MDISALKTILIDAAHTQLPRGEQARDIENRAKEDGSVVTQIDTDLQNAICVKLLAQWPSIPMLGEEMSYEQQKALLENSDTGLWVLDPLDGTSNFTTGFPIYGLSLAYVKGGETHAAVIYDPSRRECFSAQRGQGATMNGIPLQTQQGHDLASCLANIDYKRLTEGVASQLVRCPPYRSQRNVGSCVLEWCWLAANRFQLYLHGGQQLWDHAAGRLILMEAGGMASRLDGQAMVSDKLAKQSAIAASNPALYEAWIHWVNEAGRDK